MYIWNQYIHHMRHVHRLFRHVITFRFDQKAKPPERFFLVIGNQKKSIFSSTAFFQNQSIVLIQRQIYNNMCFHVKRSTILFVFSPEV